jgi:hypothetical protein
MVVILGKEMLWRRKTSKRYRLFSKLNGRENRTDFNEV